MVRFSDMLGGNGDNEGTRAATVPDAAPPGDEAITDEVDATEPVDAAAGALASPEDVLDRLTQYASTARAAETQPAAAQAEPAAAQAEPAAAQAEPAAAQAEPAAAQAEPAAAQAEPAAEELRPVGDDFLPRGKGEARRTTRRNKRRP
jgi:hypothetical protein